METSEEIMERIAADIHSGKIKKGDLIDPDLLTHIADNLYSGVTISYGKDLTTPHTTEGDARILQAMQKNVYVFSGFKTAAQIKEVKLLLHDKDGEVRPFDDFKKDVLAVNDQYNKTYLKTEYDTASKGAEMARRWSEIQDEAEHLPYLRYETVGDNRVRHSHAILDGITRRVDDPFWNQYYPPNGWNCRCDVRQVRSGEESTIPDITTNDVPKGFRDNTGQTGEVLKDDVYRSAMDKAAQAQIIQEAINLMPEAKALSKRDNQQRVLAKPVAQQYTKVASYPGGGEVHVHELADHTKPDFNDVMDIAHLKASEDNAIVHVQPEIHAKDTVSRGKLIPNAKGNSNSDLLVNGEHEEVKAPTSIGMVAKRIGTAAKQADIVNIKLPAALSDSKLANIAKLKFKEVPSLKKIVFVIGKTRKTYDRPV